MKTNLVKKAAHDGQTISGVHLTFPCPTLIEMLALQKLDFLYLDGEHGAFDLRDLEECCRAADLSNLTTIARIPDISPGTINQFLDRGVHGIIGPHVFSKADAEQLVNACYFAPVGERSWGASRGERYDIGPASVLEQMTELNANISVGVIIEDQRAIDNLDDILSVDGIDYFNFGMHDLAQSLGHPGESSHPEVLQVAEDVSKRIRAAGKRVREDFMIFAWMRDVIHAGIRSEITNHNG